MMIPTGRLLAALLLSTAAGAAGAGTWRCQGADGRVEYRDRPCTGSAQARQVAEAPAPRASAGTDVGTWTTTPAVLPAGVHDVHPPRAPAPPDKQPLSLHFDDIPLEALLHILADFNGGKRAVIDPALANVRIACHYQDTPWDAAVADVAARAGLDVRYDAHQLVAKKR